MEGKASLSLQNIPSSGSSLTSIFFLLDSLFVCYLKFSMKRKTTKGENLHLIEKLLEKKKMKLENVLQLEAALG